MVLAVGMSSENTSYRYNKTPRPLSSGASLSEQLTVDWIYCLWQDVMSGASLSKQQTADTVMAHRRWSAMLLKAKPKYYSGYFQLLSEWLQDSNKNTADQQTDKQIFPPLLIDTDKQHCQKWNWIFTNLTRGFLSHYNAAPSTINESIFNACYETIAAHLISNDKTTEWNKHPIFRAFPTAV